MQPWEAETRERTFEMPRPMGRGLGLVLAVVFLAILPLMIPMAALSGGLEFLRRFKLP